MGFPLIQPKIIHKDSGWFYAKIYFLHFICSTLRSAYGTIRVSPGKGFSRASSRGLYCFQPKVSAACLTCRQTISVSLCTRRTSWRSSLPKLHLSLKARSSVGRFPYRWVFSCQCAPRENTPHSIPGKTGRCTKVLSLHSRKIRWVNKNLFTPLPKKRQGANPHIQFFWDIFIKNALTILPKTRRGVRKVPSLHSRKNMGLYNKKSIFLQVFF